MYLYRFLDNFNYANFRTLFTLITLIFVHFFIGLINLNLYLAVEFPKINKIKLNLVKAMAS